MEPMFEEFAAEERPVGVSLAGGRTLGLPSAGACAFGGKLFIYGEVIVWFAPVWQHVAF